MPPRVPQFNWVDLGLPSGTLWLDRMVGAPSPTQTGLFYQWGDIIGHAIADGYDFSSANYEAKGLNLISTDLDDEHDAARAYYGPEAKMPTASQFQELIDNCVFSYQGNGQHLITSNINGHSMTIHGNGYIKLLDHIVTGTAFAWSNKRDSEALAFSIHVGSDSSVELANSTRYYGFNIMAVHS